MPWAELTDVRCHYQWLGQGDPLLLIAGLGGICRSWDPLLYALADDFCVLAPDPRGLGGSEARRLPTSLSHYSADLLELIDHLQLDRVHVAGISWGGVLAQRFAGDHPTRVDRLVLISTTHRFSPYLREMTRLVGHTLRRGNWRRSLHAFEVLSSSPAQLDGDPAALDQRVQLKAEYNVSRLAVAQQLRCLVACDTIEPLPKVTAPTLVVAGEFDPLIPSCYSRDTARSIPGSRFVRLEGAGHNPVAECPDRLREVMVPFLQHSRQHRRAASAAALASAGG